MGNNTILKTTPIRIKLHNSLYNNPTFTTEFMNILNDYLTADLNSHVEIDSFDFQSKTMRILKNPELEKIELEGCIHMSLIYMINNHKELELSKEEKDIIVRDIKLFMDIMYLTSTYVIIHF